MTRPMAIVGAGIVLLLVLTVAVSGERIISKNRTQTTVEQQTTVIETTGVSANESSVVEQPTDADAYYIPWQSINAGGDDMQSTNYQVMSSVGQSVIGYTASTNYEAGIGYWYGMAAGEECFCGGPPPAFGDITCDAAVNPVDVVKMVNYVYKALDDRCPPPPFNTHGWNCPVPPGDVTCEGDVNPVDVVHYVNYVYKNITPFPCDPCS